MTDQQAISRQLAQARTTQQDCYELLDQLPEDHDPDSPDNSNYARIRQASKLISDVVSDLAAAHQESLHN